MAEQACGSWPTGASTPVTQVAAFRWRGGPPNFGASAYSHQNMTGWSQRGSLTEGSELPLSWVVRENSHSGVTCMGPITIADFYRAEAARCRDRAEKAKSPQRATRWRHVAEDCLRIAAELEAVEGPVQRPAATASSR